MREALRWARMSLANADPGKTVRSENANSDSAIAIVPPPIPTRRTVEDDEPTLARSGSIPPSRDDVLTSAPPITMRDTFRENGRPGGEPSAGPVFSLRRAKPGDGPDAMPPTTERLAPPPGERNPGAAASLAKTVNTGSADASGSAIAGAMANALAAAEALARTKLDSNSPAATHGSASGASGASSNDDDVDEDAKTGEIRIAGVNLSPAVRTLPGMGAVDAAAPITAPIPP